MDDTIEEPSIKNVDKVMKLLGIYNKLLARDIAPPVFN